jgi:predicted Zn-dependent protease
MTRIWYSLLFKTALVILIAVLLFGNVTSEEVVRWVLLFVGLRLVLLVIEACQKPVSEEQWSEGVAELTRRYEALSAEEREAHAKAWGLNPSASAADLAQAEVEQARARYVAPRPRLELLAETAGLITFSLLLPADIGMILQSFFSFNRPQEAAGVGILAACLILYGLPHTRRSAFRRSLVRTFWWATPFFSAVLVLLVLVGTKHPYLNPFDPEHHRLAAERVIAIMRAGNNVVAASHVDWIFRYAHDLEARGDKEAAIEMYQIGLQLDANRQAERLRLGALQGSTMSPPTSEVPAADPYAPLWPNDLTEFPRLPRCKIDSSLDSITQCTVVIAPLGEVPDVLVDAVGYVIHRELGLPVLVAEESLPLSAATRHHGLLVGKQWNTEEISRAFLSAFPSLPAAPIKYVLLTQNDIYMDGTSFVFSASFGWGPVVSAARFIEMGPDDAHIIARTAKQSLGALLKSFGLPASPDRECVTSYVRSMDEFDSKGNRPNAQTLALFQKALAEWNANWPQSRGDRPTLEELHQQLEQLSAPRN